ncbi:MAG TPA: GAF domain-containing protein [Chloroflexota bacterium]
MPHSGSQTTDNSGLEAGNNGAAPSLLVHQVGGTSQVPEDIYNLASPLLLSLSQVLDGAPAALALPYALVEEPFSNREAAVLCALPASHSLDWLMDPFARIALAARSRPLLPEADSAPSQDQSISANGSEVNSFVWPLVVDGEDRGALAVLVDGALDDRRSAVAGGFAEALVAGFRTVYSQRRRVRAASALVEVARTAGSTLRLEEVLDLVTERTATLVGADRCGLWLVDRDRASLHPSSLYGMPPDFVQKWKQDGMPLETELLSKEAIETEQPVLVSDAPNDPRTDKEAVRFFGDKTILVLPVVARGQTQGTLFINHVRNYHRYTRGEMETAMAIASQAAIAIQNARLYREVEEWGSQLERLQAIMSKLSRSRSVSSIAGIIADELRNLIRYDNCRVLVLQEDSNELVPLAVVSSSTEYPVDTLESLRISIGQGITGHVAQTGVAAIVGDAARDPRAFYIPGTAIVDESMIAAPINFEGRVIGVITLSRLGINSFTESDLRLLEIFVSEASIEFENARLYQETQKKSRELLVSFHRVGDALATGLDLDETLQIVTNLAAEMVRAAACAIQLVDETDGTLVFRAVKGLPIDTGQGSVSSSGRGLGWRVVRENSPLLIPDLTSAERPSWMDDEIATKLRTYLGVPLVLGGRTIGVLAVFGGRTGQFGQPDAELLSSFAHQAAIAIRNAQLFVSLQERLRELAGLAEISHSVATLTNLDDTYRELSRSIAVLLHAEGCSLLLAADGSTLVPQFPSYGLSQDELSGLVFRVGEGSGDDSSGPYCPLQSVDGLVVTCRGEWKNSPWLVAPMRAQDKLIGAVLVTGRLISSFNENDIRLLTILSANAGVIVQNAILFQSVESERDELEAIIKNTSDAIILLDQDDRVARINEAAEILTGCRASEVIGRRCEELFVGQMPPEGRLASANSELIQIIERRHPVPYFEGVVVTREGEAREIAASYSYVRPAGRGEGMAVIIARDISRLREVERMKSEFASMVSHELRTPLGLIKGYASTLLNPQLSIDATTAQRFLMGIDGAADRLAKLIENIMSVSRIESGLFRLTTHEMDLGKVIANAVNTARSVSKGHEIMLDVPRRAVKVEGDRVQIELVMDNLLGNAIKYSPMGRPIRVELKRHGQEVEVRVTDEGIGIAPQHLPKVFDKFYRVEGGYSRRTPGSGLGLYICQSIVQAHGGRIWAESVPGEGSTFSFTLPVSQPRRTEDSDQDSPTQDEPGG